MVMHLFLQNVYNDTNKIKLILRKGLKMYSHNIVNGRCRRKYTET